MISPERIQEFRDILASGDDLSTSEVSDLLDEVERLRAVIRSTHNNCMRPNNHMATCKLYEIEP